MSKTCIIGRGRWASRLRNRFLSEGQDMPLLSPREDVIDVSSYEEIIICVPAYCAQEVLEKINWGEGQKKIISCAKGLLDNGQSLCQYLNENYATIMLEPASFLGGANIDDGGEIVEITKDYALEIACILKNVYAIGFGLALKKGENFAAHELSQYLLEYKSLGIPESYWADLLVSCYSDKSRNKTFGKKFSLEEQYDEKTIEGLNTAKIIEKHNLWAELKKLRGITKTIC